MKQVKHIWVTVYRCELCHVEFGLKIQRYNDCGANMFPAIDADKVVPHKCGSSHIGIAHLIGLKERGHKGTTANGRAK